MLSVRIQRAQNQLQAHHRWLRTFTYCNWIHSADQCDHSNPRTFSTSPARAQDQQHRDKQRRRPRQSASFANPRTARAAQSKPQHEHVHIPLGSLPQDGEIHQAIKDYDIKRVIALYATLPEKKSFTPEFVASLAQCVSRCLRLEDFKHGRSRSKEDIDAIVAFATQLAKDIEKGRLLPSLFAHTHLLAVFRESGTFDAGIRFWEWLRSKEDKEYINPPVYAAAIDLLAAHGHPLEELERLYQEALDLVPGNFSAYHLSPSALLRDREAEFNVPGIPMALLLSLTRARLLTGNSRDAYLALDTALRLYPSTLGHRFFACFNNERPATEVFTVFAMACRAGIQIPETLFKGLIVSLRETSDLHSVPVHFAVVGTMVAAVQLHTAGNGNIPQITANEIAIAITNVVRLPGFSRMEPEGRQKIVDKILAVNKDLLGVFACFGCRPGTAFYNAMILNIGGIAGYKPIVGMMMADMKALGVEQTDATRRTLLATAGQLSDVELLETSWQSIMVATAQKQTCPNYQDFDTLIKASRKASALGFAREQFETVKDRLHPGIRSSIERNLSEIKEKVPTSGQQTRRQPSGVADPFFEQIASFLDEVSSDIKKLLHLRQNRHAAVQDLSSEKLPVALVSPPEWLQLPDREMRKIYDELTTERPANRQHTHDIDTFKSASEFAPDAPFGAGSPASFTPKSTTNVTFGELRFQNWKATNYLLWLSEKHDRDYDAAVDHAIADRTKPPRRNLGISKDELAKMRPWALNGVEKEAFDKGGQSTIDRLSRQAKEEIVRLRRD